MTWTRYVIAHDLRGVRAHKYCARMTYPTKQLIRVSHGQLEVFGRDAVGNRNSLIEIASFDQRSSRR